ncbi:MAG: hypothetical protein EOO52_02710 [Gammaproteobacteria bacterium]|nr:MAG: hypothetical protein EOO52_02710 [Gammaproteobacteria bacterium]
MEIFGVDLSLIPPVKFVVLIAILAFACIIASLPLVSVNPVVRFIKRILLLGSLAGIIYVNIHGYSPNPYMFLLAEIVVLIVCYKLYLNILKKIINSQDVDVASRYLEEIKRKRELR